MQHQTHLDNVLHLGVLMCTVHVAHTCLLLARWIKSNNRIVKAKRFNSFLNIPHKWWFGSQTRIMPEVQVINPPNIETILVISAELGQWSSRSHVAAAESKPAACVSNLSQSNRSGCEDKASGCAAAPVSLHTSNGLCQSVCPILRVSLGAKGERRARKEWWVKAL